jgi:prevent-host-death family protein
VAVTTISSREFNQDTSGAKRASRKGPVIITDRGRPAHVLLSIEEYRAISGKGKKMSLAEALAMPLAEQVDFEPPRLGARIFRPADFS